jgi:hypothetical protein
MGRWRGRQDRLSEDAESAPQARGGRSSHHVLNQTHLSSNRDATFSPAKQSGSRRPSADAWRISRKSGTMRACPRRLAKANMASTTKPPPHQPQQTTLKERGELQPACPCRSSSDRKACALDTFLCPKVGRCIATEMGPGQKRITPESQPVIRRGCPGSNDGNRLNLD